MIMHRGAGLVLLAWACLWTACSGDDGNAPPSNTSNGIVGPESNGVVGPDTSNGTTETTKTYLEPAQHLARASIALRGKRPSLEEMEMVEADPSQLEVLVDRYLGEPEFGDTIRDMHNDIWQTRSYLHWFPPLGELQEVDLVSLNGSIAESPLKLIEHVVMNDRPYSEIVTANYAIADGVVASVWGLDYEGDGIEWIKTRWSTSEDGRGPWPGGARPHAGILSDSYLFVRHDSTVANQNRGRANVISRSLLCFDFLNSDIQIDASVDLSDPEAVADAVKTNPGCVGCHQSLDPLGQFFWIYELRLNTNQLDIYPGSEFYRPERVELAREVFPDLRPGYFGQTEPTQTYWNVKDLGKMIVEDPRFTLCTAKRFYSYFTHTPLEEVPFEESSKLQKLLLDNNQNTRALVKAIVLSDAFRESASDDAAQAEQLAGLKRVRPNEMANVIEEMTGLSWSTELELEAFGGNYGRLDLMRDSLLGFQVLAGGIDSYQVQTPLETFNATAVLTQRVFAQDAASHVVGEDLANEAGRRKLLTDVNSDQTDAQVIRAQLAKLHMRLFSERVAPDSEEVDLSYGLWQEAYALSNDTVRAWKITLSAMFQDPRFVFH